MLRRLLPTLILLLLAAAPAAAADLQTVWGATDSKPLPQLSAADRTGGVLKSARPAKRRHALGLPSYRELLGRGWQSKVRAADARFVAELLGATAKAAQTPAQNGIDDDPLKAKDVLRRGRERQKRTMRLAIAVLDTCPNFPPDKNLGGTIRSRLRAEHTITTVERVGRHDVTTLVTFELRAEARASASSQAVLGEPVVDVGKISVTRQQTIKDRKTGKVKSLPLQTAHQSLSPLWVLDGDFSDFIREQEDGIPRERKLRSAAWDDLAQKFVAAVYASLIAAHQPAADRIATPNACLKLEIPAPERLAPGQTIKLTPVASATHMHAHFEQIFWQGSIRAFYVDPQGAVAKSLIGGDGPKAGEPWYEVTAPPQPWPEERPFGLTIRITTHAGVAEATVLFRPLQGLPARYRVLEASFNVYTSAEARFGFCEDFGPISGTRRFSGGGAATPDGNEAILEQEIDGSLRGWVGGRVPAQWSDDTTAGCKMDANWENKIPCSYTHPNHAPKPDGTWRTGFSIRADSPAAGEAVITWSIPDPDVGFFDAGNEECFTYIWAPRDVADDRQTVPLQKLLEPGPQTFTFSGSKTWTQDSLGRPAHITQTWTYTLTLERIG